MVESESGEDGAYIEYSLNNGQTWLTLGGIDDPDGYHWYTDYLTMVNLVIVGQAMVG